MQSSEAQTEQTQLLRRFSLDVTSSRKPTWTGPIQTRIVRPSPGLLILGTAFWYSSSHDILHFLQLHIHLPTRSCALRTGTGSIFFANPTYRPVPSNTLSTYLRIECHWENRQIIALQNEKYSQ